MSGKVLKFDPVLVGEGYRFDGNEILEGAKGQNLETITILGETADGKLWVSGNANVGQTLVLMEKAKRLLVFGEET